MVAVLEDDKSTSVSFPVTGMTCAACGERADEMYDELVDLMYTYSR